MLESLTYVSPRYPPDLGGIETHVSELASRMNESFDSVRVIATDPHGNLPRSEHVKDGFDVFRVRSFAPGENYHMPWIPAFLKRLRESESQVLHVHGIQDVTGPFASMLDGRSILVLTPHFSGQFPSGFSRLLFAGYRPLLLNQLIGKVSTIICVSKFEARSVSEILPASAPKIRIIPNGVDADLLSKYRWRGKDNGSIMYAGRLERRKNVDKLIRAFQQLHTIDPKLNLIVVGKGPMKEELVRLAHELGLGQEVRWINGLNKEDLYSLYCSCTVVVLPSDFECFGLVAAEAISLGVPTVVTDASALAEFVEKGLAEPISTPVEPGGLRLKLSEILEDPKSYSHSRRGAETIPSWDDVAHRTSDLYEELIKR